MTTSEARLAGVNWGKYKKSQRPSQASEISISGPSAVVDANIGSERVIGKLLTEGLLYCYTVFSYEAHMPHILLYFARPVRALPVSSVHDDLCLCAGSVGSPPARQYAICNVAGRSRFVPIISTNLPPKVLVCCLCY